MNTFFNQLTKIIFLIGLLLFSEQISAQHRPSGPHRPTTQQVAKSYKYNELVIMKPGNINNGITYGDSPNRMIGLLGNPNKIKDYYSEIEEVHGKIYYYNKNRIYVLNNRVSGYDLYDETLAFGKLNAFQIKVGDNITYRTLAGGRRGAPHIGGFEVTTNRSRVPEKGMNIEFTDYVRNSGLLNVNNEIIDDAGFDVLIRNNKVVFIHLGEY